MDLWQISSELQEESVEIECVSSLDRNDSVSWLKHLAGFANAFGGVLYIGVEDKNNELTGFDRNGVLDEYNYFHHKVTERLHPKTPLKIFFLRYEVDEQERLIIRVQVPESVLKPVILDYNDASVIFMRREGYTDGASYGEIIEMCEKHREAQNRPEEVAGDSDRRILFLPVANGTDLDERVLAYCYRKARKAADIAEYLGISDSTYLRKQVLGNLVEHQYLKANKEGRAICYRTNADVVMAEEE